MCIVPEEPPPGFVCYSGSALLWLSIHGKPSAAGQEHPVSSGHKATKGLQGTGASWMVLQMPHLGEGQSLGKCRD